MTEANKYSYKSFKEYIFPRIISELSLEEFYKQYEKGLNAYKPLLDKTMGSAYTSKLQHIIFPKLIRQNGHNISNYLDDMWHAWIIATWSVYGIQKIQQASNGTWHWKIDFDEDHYGNSNAYLNSNDTECY